MLPKTRVLIYGDSLFLAGVRTVLEQLPSIELLIFAPKLNSNELIGPAALEQLRPDVLLFDAARGSAQELFELFRQNPTIRLIGLNGQEQTAMVSQWNVMSLALPSDLTQLILER